MTPSLPKTYFRRSGWPLAASLLLSACDHPDALASTQAWLIQARATAIQQRRHDKAPSATSPAVPTVLQPAPEADDTSSDPFSMAQARPAAVLAMSSSALNATADLPPAARAVRALGVMLQGDRGQAIIELDGTLLRLATGQALPRQQGRLLRISPDEVQLLLDGQTLRLPVGAPRARAMRQQEGA